MIALSVAGATAPFVALGLLAVFVSWRRAHRFEGCCPPPEKGRVWVCGHRKTWFRDNLEWRRITRRRYIRLAMDELDYDIEKAIRGGRKF